MEINKSIVLKDLTDSLRGILALMIVFSHLSYVTHIYFFSLMNKLGTTVVALFFFISGYGITKSYYLKRESYLSDFLKRRVLSVFLPMVFISLVYVGVQFFISKSLPSNFFYDLFVKGYTPLPNTWFIFCLIYFYTFFYIAFRYSKDNNMSILFVFLFSTIYIVTAYYLGYSRNWWIQTYAFGAGILFSTYEKRLYCLVRKPMVILLNIVFVFFILYLNNEKLLVFPYLVIPIVVLSLLSYIHFPYKNKILKFLSKISFEIYLIHGAVIALLYNTVLYHNHYFFSLVVIILSIVLAYLFNIFWNTKVNPLLNL